MSPRRVRSSPADCREAVPIPSTSTDVQRAVRECPIPISAKTVALPQARSTSPVAKQSPVSRSQLQQIVELHLQGRAIPPAVLEFALLELSEPGGAAMMVFNTPTDTGHSQGNRHEE